jgi:hypothetical protein
VNPNPWLGFSFENLYKLRILYALIAIALSSSICAQTGTITGRVFDKINNEPLPFTNVVIDGTTIGATTDLDGNYTLSVEPGLYNITASFLGYKNFTEYEIQVSLSRPAVINFGLDQNNQTLGEVEVSAQDRFQRKAESPVSVSTLGINEIQRNPGGNQDISLVIQSLPGVASSPNFRNDIIIRGGAPNENSFFLDGIEIPSINHFSTQGSSGGPVGLLNVNFIREVDLYTSAFPVEKANSLSSVLDIKLKDGRTDKIGGIFQVGASDVGLTLEGPLSDKTTFLFSARRSYLQFLFSLLDLPFLPTYNDFQYKVKYKIDDKNQLTFIGLGAIDNFKLNLDANETESQQFQLANLPVNEQWNYSVGAKWTHFGEKSYTNVILSRFMLNNTAFKYEDNDESKTKLLDYNSQEIENKLRVENFYRENNWRITSGFGFEQIKYITSEIDLRVAPGAEPRNYDTKLTTYQYFAFGNLNRSFYNERLNATVGLRVEGNSFNSNTANPLNQFSPKIALAWNVTPELSFNNSFSIYYQLPPSTALGFRDQAGTLVNEDLTFISTRHYVSGFTYYLPWSAKISLEGFLKQYSDYPFLLERGITLANLGSDFGVIGNEPASSISSGRAYGLEFLYQQKLYAGWFGTFAYTLVKSEFEDDKGNLVPSSWDNQHIITVTGGKKFGKNWELGIQYQLLGGAPFTPTDVETSSLVSVYDVNRRGLPDWSRLNQNRFSNFNRVNLRIDKKWFFEKWALNVYLDVQNLLGQSVDGEPLLVLNRDANGEGIVLNPLAPVEEQRYDTRFLENGNGTRIPSVGIIIQF